MRNLRDVAIIGVGITKFGNLADRSLFSLACEASQKALKDANINVNKIQSFYLGNTASECLAIQGAPAAYVARNLGIKDIPCTKVEGACASASIALRLGYLTVATEMADYVLVTGVEKMSGASPERLSAAMFCAMENEKDGWSGLTFPAFFSLCMQRHMYEYGTTRRQVAMVSVQNRANGSVNPICYYQNKTTIDDVLAARLIAGPMTLFDSCNRADGAAAAVICPLERAKEFTSKPIRILASTQSIGTPSISDTESLTSFRATVVAAKQAYEMAGLGPEDIDVAEVHDCTTITEIIDVEDLGFVKKGEGGPAIEEGVFSLNGRIPANPSGGLLSKGHPFGATGLGQIYEIVLQLRGEAVNQVPGAKVGLAQNIGGTGATGTVHILGR